MTVPALPRNLSLPDAASVNEEEQVLNRKEDCIHQSLEDQQPRSRQSKTDKFYSMEKNSHSTILDDPERRMTMESIFQLGSHLPVAVLDFLIERVKKEEKALGDLLVTSFHIPAEEAPVALLPLRELTREDQSSSVNFLGEEEFISQLPLRELTGEDEYSVMSDLDSIGSKNDKRISGEEDYGDLDDSVSHDSCSTSFDSEDTDPSSSFSDFLDYSLPVPPCPRTTENRQEVVRLRQNRMMHALDSSVSSEVSDTISQNDSLTARSHFHYNVQTSAICFIDISGFTNLSQCLELDALSKTINNYFELIVEEINRYSGDILKFAGDALIAEWRVGLDSELKGFTQQEAALTAATCAAKIVDKCSDFPVIRNGANVATLNVHCGMAFGTVVGAHVGDADRVEYLILGETIRQIAAALDIAEQGEVVASPEALKQIELDLCERATKETTPPRVIARKSEKFFKCNQPILSQELTESRSYGNILVQCKTWNKTALKRLQKHMSHYVHPVVLLQDEIATDLCPEDRNGQELLHEMKAELREVFTVFIHPEMDIDLTGKDAYNHNTIQVLNEIMLIVNYEAKRFKGQLRQFIVDDKGLVVIANFGLCGSTFPCMIEERAMPCITNIQKLLKTELGIDCKLGATFGKAYCGVVGGTYRHEYAILGPPVNLAARLMASKDNPGFLVDEAVKSKACSIPFRSLPPIIAKGYTDPVKIFTPAKMTRKFWRTDVGDIFVGRKEELHQFTVSARSVITEKCAKFTLISGPYGYGKSCLLAKGVEQITNAFPVSSKSCIALCHVFCEEDSFHPFSVIRPIFLDLLRFKAGEKTWSQTLNSTGHSSEETELSEELDEAKLYVILLQLCMECQIPLNYVEIFGGLIFTTKLSDIGKWSDRNRKMSEWNAIVRYFVDVFLHCTKQLDLVLLAFDDISGMDEMSWKILEILYNFATNVLIVGACRNPCDMNIHPQFWAKLENDTAHNNLDGRFKHLKLDLFDQSNIQELYYKILDKDGTETGENIAQVTYSLSEGNPLMATEILNKLYRNKDKTMSSFSAKDLGHLGELLLNRLDSLPPTVRLYLRFGAIVGYCFELNDLMKVIERYYKVQEDELVGFIEAAQKNMDEAVKQGILDVKDDGCFTFTHPFWIENISRLALGSWKEDITSLLQQRRD